MCLFLCSAALHNIIPPFISIMKVKHQIDVMLTVCVCSKRLCVILRNDKHAVCLIYYNKYPWACFSFCHIRANIAFQVFFFLSMPTSVSCFGPLKNLCQHSQREIKLDSLQRQTQNRPCVGATDTHRSERSLFGFVIWLFPVHWWIGNDGLRLRMLILCSCPPSPSVPPV